jgi:hypothetical protein
MFPAHSNVWLYQLSCSLSGANVIIKTFNKGNLKRRKRRRRKCEAILSVVMIIS